MNYRHAYHAGNFADVLKHVGLVAVLLHLRKKDKPFAVIDTHGGRGLYDIGGEEARKTDEAATGIQRLAEGPLPAILSAYAELARGFGAGLYPGSPLIAARLLREKDRLVVIEKHPEEHAALEDVLAAVKRVRVIAGDGYGELKRLVPPPERRGVVLIDPPYEAESEFADAARALLLAWRRFATGIYLLWYPAKDRAAIDAAIGELLGVQVASLLQVELDIGHLPPKAEDRGPPLTASGLLVLNPPYGFAAEMEVILPFLANRLARGEGAGWMVKQWVGEG